MERVRIFNTDSSIIIARKIYNHFTVGQSCTIEGFTQRHDMVEPLGDIVWAFIREMDYEENYVREPGRKPRRKYREPGGDSLGGRVAHKIFKKKQEVRSTGLVTHIWRFQ